MGTEQFGEIDWGTFKFQQVYKDRTVEVSIKGESMLPEVLEAFEAFLRAAGFSFNGTLVIDEGVEPDFDPEDYTTWDAK